MPAGGATIGQVSIRVLPNTSDFLPSLESYLQRVEARTKIEIPTSLNTKELDAELVAKIREAQAAASIKVATELDARRLREETRLATVEAGAGQDVKVGVNFDRSQLKSLETAAGSALSSLTGLARPFVGSIAITGLASIVSVAGEAAVALSQLAGAAALIPGLGIAGAAAAGTLITGFKGVGAALSEMGKSQTAAGDSGAKLASDALNQAIQIRNAKQSIADAEDAVSRARDSAARSSESAARSVVSAEKSLASAQESSLIAQQDLTRAREEATRAMEDLNEQVKGGALDMAQAQLDLQKAQQRLAEIGQKKDATDLDRKQAILDVQKQQEAIEKLTIQNRRLGEESAHANQVGIEGSDQVVAAKQKIADANQRVQDAQQSVADAVRAQSQTQIDGARQIADAQKQVAKAQQSLADVMAKTTVAASTASGGVDKVAEAMAKISPNARALVAEIHAQSDAWQAVKFSVQDALFNGAAQGLASLSSTYLPVLRTGLTAIATQFNGIGSEIGAFATNAATVRDTGTVFANTATSVGILRNAVRDVLPALRDIGTVGSTFLPGLAQGAANAAAHFREFIASARESGQLATFIQNGLNAIRQLGQIVGNVGSILGSVFRAANASGASLFAVLARITGSMAAFLKSAQGATALNQVFGGIHAAMQGLMPVFAALGTAFRTAIAPAIATLGPQLGKAFAALAPAIAPLGRVIAALAPVVGALANLFAHVLATAITNLAPIIIRMAGPLTALINRLAQSPGTVAAFAVALVGIGKALTFIPGLIQFGVTIGPLIAKAGGLSAILEKVGGAFKFAFGPIGIAVGLFAAMVAHSEPLRAALGQVVSVIGQLVSSIGAALAPVFKQLSGAITPIITILGNALAPVVRVIAQVIQMLIPPITQVVGVLVSAFRPILQTIIGVFRQLMPPITTLVSTIASALMPIFRAVVPIISAVMGPVVRLVGSIGQLLIPIIKALLPVVKDVFSIITTVIKTALGVIQGIIKVVTGVISGNWHQVWQGIKDIVSSVVHGIGDAVSGMFHLGEDIVKGILNGILSMGKWLYDRLVDFAKSTIPGPIARALGIHSPSKVMADQIGHWIPAGIAEGIQSNSGSVTGAMDDLAGIVSGHSFSAAADVTASLAGSGFADVISDAIATNLHGTKVEADGRAIGRLVTVQQKAQRGR